MALDERGVPVIILEPNKHIVKVQISDQKNVTGIPYRIDAQNNLLLPQGWRFMTRDERRVPKEHFVRTPEGGKLYKDGWSKEFQAIADLYNGHRKKMLDLGNLRHPIASQYLMKGFHDFWEEFKAIAEPAYLDMHKTMHSWL